MLPRKRHRIARKRKRYYEIGTTEKQKKIPREISSHNKVMVSPSSLEEDSSTALSFGTNSNTVSSSSGSRKTWEDEAKSRIAILEVYKHMGEPAAESWGGHNGVLSTLQRVFKDTHRYTIEKVLTEYNRCEVQGRKYDPARKARVFKGEYLIPKDSYYEQLVADSMEDGNGLNKTARLVNHALEKDNKTIVGRSAVRECYLRLNPVKIKLKKRPQGTNDAHSEWSIASFNIAKQLAIQYGKLNPRTDPDPPMPPRIVQEDHIINQFASDVAAARTSDSVPKKTTSPVFGPEPLPDYFNPDKLEPLHRCQVAYWDETHRVCDLKSSISRTAKGLDYVYRFHRDEDGAIDPNGCLRNDDPTVLKVKYEEEVRLALGVFLYQYPCGKIEGRRIEPFSYTCQTIVTEVEWNRKIKYEIERVKKLKGDKHGNKGPWTMKSRNDRIFSKDKLTMMKGIGPVVGKRLEEHGLVLVEDIIKIKDDEEKKAQAIRTVKGLSKNIMLLLLQQLGDVHPGECPPNLDHTCESNPYKSLWLDEWQTKIEQSAALSPYTSINKLITHIFTSTEKAFKGSRFEKTWRVYHDALKLMMGKDAVAFMKTNGWYDRLLKPSLGLNKGTIYAARTVGCRPEFQVLDYHLNEDSHNGVDDHCIITRHLSDDDPLKFSTRTPKQMLSAYLRIWDTKLGTNGCPSAKRIEEDINRLVDETYLRVVQLRGISLPEVMYSGRRAKLVGRRGGHGGVRKNSTSIDIPWVHPSVAHLDERYAKTSKSIWVAKMEKV